MLRGHVWVGGKEKYGFIKNLTTFFRSEEFTRRAELSWVKIFHKRSFLETKSHQPQKKMSLVIPRASFFFFFLRTASNPALLSSPSFLDCCENISSAFWTINRALGSNLWALGERGGSWAGNVEGLFLYATYSCVALKDSSLRDEIMGGGK